MSKKLSDMLDEAIDSIKEMTKKIKTVSDTHQKIDSMLDSLEFDVKMGILSMSIIKSIMDEADDANEALSYVSRLSHSLVEAIDRRIEEIEKAEETEEDEDKDGPVH